MPDKMPEKRKNFALLGAAGYIAPRHMKAIKETGNFLVAIIDPSDSVGIIDSYFPSARYFREFESYNAFVQSLSHENSNGIDYLSICSPNYLHAAHIHSALASGSNAICEKPLVKNPDELDTIERAERLSGKKVNCILQLRLHQAVIELRKDILSLDGEVDAELTYITSRGSWYHDSWKGDLTKSGGIASNIGIHFFDMLHWLLGTTISSKVFLNSADKMSGVLKFRRGKVRWFLSLDENDIPSEARALGKRTYRSIRFNEKELEFSGGFTDLHTLSYENILSGGGFGIDDARPSIEIAHSIQASRTAPLEGDYHPFLREGKK